MQETSLRRSLTFLQQPTIFKRAPLTQIGNVRDVPEQSERPE